VCPCTAGGRSVPARPPVTTASLSAVSAGRRRQLGEGQKVADIVSRIHELQLQAQHLGEAVAQVGALPHLVTKIREVESALQTARGAHGA
jgi:hypothetical protein